MKNLDIEKIINSLVDIMDSLAQMIGWAFLILGIFLVRCGVFGQTANIAVVSVIAITGIWITIKMVLELLTKEDEKLEEKDDPKIE